MTQQLAALDIYNIIHELQDLIGSYIDKIYQLSNDEVIIRVNNRKTKQKEILYANCDGIFFRTDQSFETPMKPTTFAMTLRKHIGNGRITAIEQHEFDRIIKIIIQKREEYTLLFELIPNGNTILLNQDNHILMPLKHQHWSQRSIRTKSEYQPPPSQVNPFTLSFEDFDKLIQESDADLVRTCAVKLSLGGRYAEEFCAHLSLPKEILAKELSTEQRKKIFDQFQKFLQPFKKYQFSPTIVDDDHKKIITPFPFTIYKGKPKKSLDSFSKGIQKTIDIHTEKKTESPFEKKKGKIIRQQKQQEKAIKEFDKKIQNKKHQGDVIYLHYPTIETLLNEIQNNRKLLTKKELTTMLNQKEIVKQYSPDSPMITLLLPDETKKSTPIQIDFRKSVTENAEAAYNQSKKLAQKKEGAIKALEITKQKLSSIQKQEEQHAQQQTKKEQNKQKPQKQFWFEKYRWCIASNGNLILGGKDAKTNDQLIKKHLEKEDRYAHADIHGAPSCIIKNKDVDGNQLSFPEDTLQEGCIFSACYSRAWKQFAESQAYWVFPNQVSKTPQSGEFVPKGAFIIRGKRNYCTCKMQIGIGIITIEETKKVMGGPPSAIKKWCKQHVIIEPGTEKSSNLAKKIGEVLDSNPTRIQQVLPAGESRIISTSKP